MLRSCLILSGILMLGCTSVVPPDEEFITSRCKLVLEDGVEGMPTFELGAIFEVTTPAGQPDEGGTFTIGAMRMAIQELNDRDIAGKRFRMRICDTRADWSTGGGEATRDLAKWLVEHEHVQAIISDASSDTQTIQAVTVPKGVLVMAISSTSEDLSRLLDKGLVWRIAPSDIYQGAVLAHMVSSTVAETDKVSVLAVQNPYGDGLVDALSKQLGKRLISHTFASDGKGIDAALQAAATDAPKALIVIGTSAVVAQIANARASLPALAAVPLYLADGACDASLAKQTLNPGVSLAGAHCTTPGQRATPIYDQFHERYVQKFSADPGKNSYSQHAFDAVYCVALAHAWALRQGGPGKVDGTALAEGLRHLSKGDKRKFKPSEINAMISSLGQGQDIDVEGASGLLDFNPETGEAPSDYADWTLGEHGELKSSVYLSIKDLGNDKYAVTPAP